MKIKIKYIAQQIAMAFSARATFCNIADGTHEGVITMKASEDVRTANVIVTRGRDPHSFYIAGSSSKPIGVCIDQGAKGDILPIVLPASSSSTLLCKTNVDVSTGDSLYTSANGCVTKIADNGAYKIGIAVMSASSGALVEIDPQGFGESAWKISASGIFEWNTSTNVATENAMGVSTDDIIIANIHTAGGTEKSVNAKMAGSDIIFTLDANGVESTTKIAWIAIRKN